MMRITHIFFDVHDVLVDRAPLRPCYEQGIGRILSERYGGNPDQWALANRRIVNDWDSYFADLDFSADDGIRQIWEGEFRTTRALFRLTGTPEPPHDELIALSRELPGLAPRGCNVIYPDAPDALKVLRGRGLTLGVVSHAFEGQIRASLEPVIDLLNGTIWGSDTAEHFDKDPERYLLAAHGAKADPSACIVVDDKRRPLDAACSVGMTPVMCDRVEKYRAPLPYPTIRQLKELAALIDHIERTAQA